MARKGIREFDAKRLLGNVLPGYGDELALVGPETDIAKLGNEHPWLNEQKLVVKPDQLFGKRGKHGLIGAGLDLKSVQKWIKERMGKEQVIGDITGTLTHFLIEPFVEHKDEFYVAMTTTIEKDIIYLSNEGGVDIESNWENVCAIEIMEGEELDMNLMRGRINEIFPKENVTEVIDFVENLYSFFCEAHFTYLEINPLTIADGKIVPLDCVAKVDDTASYECRNIWGKSVDFPVPFGRNFTKEEAFIEEMDAKTGASLKLSVLKPDARIWTMVAGGGASVIYADTISDLGFGGELANYGEYSGNPSKDATYHYATTILDLMTRKKAEGGKKKYLFIGGGIANFTDVAKTFTGIVKALKEYAPKLKETGVEIFVRRGGPNYKVGLQTMRDLGNQLGLPIEVYGPETHMTNIVSIALNKEQN